MTTPTFLCFLCLYLLTQFATVQSYNMKIHNPNSKLLRQQLFRENPSERFAFDPSLGSLPVHIAPQDGLKKRDKIDSLPGQPEGGVEFDQYSGYVTVDPDAGRALFYYFTESPHSSTTKPLVLWLNGGPGCSSLGGGAFTELGPFRVSKDGKTLYKNQYSWNHGPGCSSLGAGAFMELGPFRVHKDGKTLYKNQYSWNHEANIIFLESPAGVGFSYSNRTSDYNLSGDKRTAHDSYTFIVNWLERFPEYKSRDFFITGESYAGHYVPQLAQTILHHNKYANRTIINLKGIAIGNALVDNESNLKGSVDFFWSHALISDEIYTGLISSCNFSYPNAANQICLAYFAQLDKVTYDIYPYDIYAPLCNSSYASNSIPVFDPCSEYYVQSYLNIPKVQTALHANVTSLHYPWEQCSDMIGGHWKDQPSTVLPVIQELMESGMRVWIYSGDTDGGVPVTCTRYSINKLGVSVRTAWYPWYVQEEVGGYAVEYQNMTFVTIRGSGHFVPSYQPARSLVFFSSFIHGNLPPSK